MRTYLIKSSAWDALYSAQKAAIEDTLPITREDAPEYKSSLGLWQYRSHVFGGWSRIDPANLQTLRNVTSSDGLFEQVLNFPDPDALKRYNGLVGVDATKERLEKEAEVMLRPDLLEKWSKDKHNHLIVALDTLLERAPLFIFAGDVGTGKTELATSFGDRLARATNIDVELFNLSLRARGTGLVGEMTTLISDAIRVFRTKCPKLPGNGKKPTGAAILLIDEADAIAQSREMAQMHHEDRAGVNALIRGIDDIAKSKLSGLVIMSTNRMDAIDPAVRRRCGSDFNSSVRTRSCGRH